MSDRWNINVYMPGWEGPTPWVGLGSVRILGNAYCRVESELIEKGGIAGQFGVDAKLVSVFLPLVGIWSLNYVVKC